MHFLFEHLSNESEIEWVCLFLFGRNPIVYFFKLGLDKVSAVASILFHFLGHVFPEFLVFEYPLGVSQGDHVGAEGALLDFLFD